MQRTILIISCAILLTSVACTNTVGWALEYGAGPRAPMPGEMQNARTVTFQQCVDIALEHNRWRPVSQFNVEIAQAQLKQALSTYWPQLGATASYQHMDEPLNFIFPEINFTAPASTMTVDTMLGTLPVNVPPQSVTVPAQDIKLMDEQTGAASLNLMYPLYTGGKRSAVVKQAESGLAAARQEARRTDLQVIYDVKRTYYGAVLAKRLCGIAEETLARMEVTLELTEHLYKGGSMQVKKTDYLRNKTVVEGLRATVAFLKGNERLTLAALTNVIGLDWDSEIDVAEAEVPFRPHEADLKRLVGSAYRFNPDWNKLEEGIKAAEAHIDEKTADHFPQIALVGNLTHIENSYDKGIATADNKDSWTAGIVMELLLFKGFRTKQEVKEARARLGKLQGQKVLLREGIALQVKDAFIQMARSQDQKRAMDAAVTASEESRDLNERAYQEELVETKDVIEAQLVESFVKANYEKILYDHIEAQARLDFVVGREIAAVLDR
jgi:outer membrane protein